jgi:hypothetical protein
MAMFRAVAFSCLHAPITHKGYFDWLIRQIEEFRPTHIYNLGDWLEGLAATRHVKDPRHNWDAQDELDALLEQHRAIRDAAPDAKLTWLWGNHDDNLLGVHGDRLDPALRRLINNSGALKEVRDSWLLKPYRHSTRAYLGQLSFGHGCSIGNASGKDEAYSYGVPYGLDVRGHTHRPEPVTQARERQALLPFHYCNVGTGADWSKMHYMDRNSMVMWGRGMLKAEVSCSGEGRQVQARKNWDAEVLVHSFASPERGVLVCK